MRRWGLSALLLIGACAAGALFLSRQPGQQAASNSTIHLQLRAFALNLDPATMADTESRKVATLLYVGLVATNEDGSAEPRIAKSWRRIDPKTWEFDLKEGLTFADGTKVTAAKVVTSLCASMQPSNVQAWSLASIEHEDGGPNKPVICTGLKAEGMDKVLVRESSPTAWLLEALAGPGGWIVDTDPAKKGSYGVRPGLGPFVVNQVIPDQRIVLDRRRNGTALMGNVDHIIFDYVPDPSLAARTFETGKLDLLEIDSPQLADLALRPDGNPLRPAAKLERFDVDRVRVVDFNLKRLAAKGFSESQLHSLLAQYSKAILRMEIAQRSRGLAKPMTTGFPPYSTEESAARNLPVSTGEPPFPKLTLTLITENDPYSDGIAAGLPMQVGNVSFRYQTMDKSLLVDALLKGNFDLSLMKLEATHHTPKFWAAFFSPGNAYNAFGSPIVGMDNIDLSNKTGIRQAALLVDTKGSWVGVLKEIGVFASAKGIYGVRKTGSGQLSFETIGKSP